MPVSSSEFNNEFTVGETKAVLAPLVQRAAEDIDGYIVITVGHEANQTVIGLVSNDEHPECRIRLLAKAIELTAGDMPNA